VKIYGLVLSELVSLTLVYSSLVFYFFSLFRDNNNFNSHKRSSLENGSKMLLELFYH